MSARSATGQWVVASGGRVVGPFDGRTPALAFRRRLTRLGVVAELQRLWDPADAQVWLAQHGPVAS